MVITRRRRFDRKGDWLVKKRVMKEERGEGGKTVRLLKIGESQLSREKRRKCETKCEYSVADLMVEGLSYGRYSKGMWHANVAIKKKDKRKGGPAKRVRGVSWGSRHASAGPPTVHQRPLQRQRRMGKTKASRIYPNRSMRTTED